MRGRKPLLALLALALAAGWACTGSDRQEGTAAGRSAAEVAADELDQARRTVKSASSDFLGTLLDELRAHGPAEALHACSLAAQDTATVHSMGDVKLRRVSLKYRNAADAPDDFERAVLERWDELHQRGELPQEHAEIVDVDGASRLRYMKPILVIRPCLNCHGDPGKMAPGVNARLAQEYPEDQATGYDVGDLRGAFSVTLDLERAGS